MFLLRSCLLTLLVSLTATVSAQYYSIPADTTFFWKQRSACANYQYQIRFAKDTIIWGQVYQKYSQYGGTISSNPCASFTRHAFLRQDTFYRQVFILDQYLIEWPLYNFSLIKGASMLFHNRHTGSLTTLNVDSTATVQFGDGTIRKCQWVSGENYFNLFIEGLGSWFGGLYAHNERSKVPFNITEELVCFGKTEPFNILYSGNTGLDCFVINTGLEDNLKADNKVLIGPNPAYDQVKIESAGGKLNAVSLYDLSGTKLLEQGNLSADILELNLLQYAPGIYFITVNTPRGLQHFKLILAADQR